MPNEVEASLGERLNRKLHHLFTALVLIWVVLGSFRPVMDNVDLGWHIAQGRWIIHHAAFYRHDLFNYPNLDHGLIAEYPLFQVILYLAWSLGWWGPCLLTALIYVVIVGALIRAARQFDLAASALPALAIGLMLIFFQIAAPLRPHVATYLGVILLGIFLLRHRNETSWTAFWPMALLQIAWTNSHSAFVFGPAMVAVFGAEMILRNAIHQRAIPWATIRTWLAAFLLILLACFVNPSGWERFIPPIYQDRMEAGRAFVGEMQPLTGGLATIYGFVSFLTAIVIALAIFFRRGTICYTFLLFTVFFYFEALGVKKAWPIFGLFIPLLVLGTGAFSHSFALRKQQAWPSVLGHSLISILIAATIFMELASPWPMGIASLWKQYNEGRTELSIESAAWMNAHGIKGRLLHRDEDGGLLQQAGFDQGETFSDTGWGKFDYAFIHDIGMVNERPAAIPLYLKSWQPEYVVCSTFCYQWPYYLRQNGWRLIFYSPNSSVWTQTSTRPDLPTVSDSEIAAAFDQDISTNGLPPDKRLLGRNLIALNSIGLEDFAFAKLTSLPPDLHNTPWYWEAARFMCFSKPEFSPAHRALLLKEANQLHDDGLTAEFRAYALYANGDTDAALHLLESIPPAQLSNYTAELLLKIYVDRHDPRALALAQRTDCFDLRNGHRWQLLAQAEEQATHSDAASRAWQKAVYYSPDDPALLAAAQTFATQNHDAPLTHAIDLNTHIYKTP